MNFHGEIQTWLFDERRIINPPNCFFVVIDFFRKIKTLDKLMKHSLNLIGVIYLKELQSVISFI